MRSIHYSLLLTKHFLKIKKTFCNYCGYNNYYSPNHESALVERNGREVKYGAEDCLHDGNDEATMNDKLTK